ncbi:MAG TPA: hypothetical protein PKG95_09855 [Anaerolineaceae bacterium]|jgi:glyoxylase-like metal-dependent hydrolase (beta-lactamase superfamily II)|nr:hypothetical protein [Anaerolineaceae bacterium]
MQQIASHVYIETAFPGVTLGAINWAHGLILIDAPLRSEDARSWRSALLNLGGGVDRMLINLDPHYDRTLGVRALECMVLGHEKMTQTYRSRSASLKSQGSETGAEWELQNNLTGIRWAPPEITFTDTMQINWDGEPLVLTYRPGPAPGAIWAELPVSKVIFVGDAVLAHQPPFLAQANLPVWLETLGLLLEPCYQDHLIISGRGGLISRDDVQFQLTWLENLHHEMEELAGHKVLPEQTEKLTPALLKTFSPPAELESIYRQRLRWGLHQYYLRHYRPSNEELEE